MTGEIAYLNMRACLFEEHDIVAGKASNASMPFAIEPSPQEAT